MRPTGSRNTLIRIDYDVIGQLAGIAGDTAKQYAYRGEYDPRILENVLQRVNGRRASKGLLLLGLPTRNAPEPLDCSVGDSNVTLPYAPPPPRLTGGYDPLLGGYRSDGDLAVNECDPAAGDALGDAGDVSEGGRSG